MPNNDRPLKRCYVRVEHEDLPMLLNIPFARDLEEARRVARDLNEGVATALSCATVVKVYPKRV